MAIVGMRRPSADNLDAADLQDGFESDVEVIAGGERFDSCNGDSGGIYTRIDQHLEFINTVGAPYGAELRL